MLNLTEAQLAYLAGFIDAEASLECQQERVPRGATPRFTLRLSITLATDEPIRTICQWLGTTYKTYPAVDDRRSPRIRAHIYKSIAVELLGACLPYLILKKRQAELILAIEAVRAEHSPPRRHMGSPIMSRMPDAAIVRMTDLHTQLRALKSNKRPGGPRTLMTA
jgi:hypothetical protein